MTRGSILGIPAAVDPSLPAAADDPGRDAYMIRMLSCKGTDANMEVYIPRSAGNYCERSLRRHVSKLCDWAAAEFVAMPARRSLIGTRLSASAEFVATLQNLKSQDWYSGTQCD